MVGPKTSEFPGVGVARRSIEHELPLIIGGLLLVAIFTIAIASYIEVKKTSMRTAEERLVSVRDQFRELFQASGGQIKAVTAAVSERPAVTAFARTGNPRMREAVLADFRVAGTAAANLVASELRDSLGRVLVSNATPALGLDSIDLGDVLPRAEPGDSAIVGSFHIVNDTVLFPTAVQVKGAPNAYLVQWRRMVGSRRTRDQLTQLVGTGGSIFLGNSRGEEWHDLERPVKAPGFDRTATTAVQTYRRGDSARQYLAAMAQIPGTPWMVAIDSPFSVALAPVNAFVRRVALLGLIVLALSLVAAWYVSRRITNPLGQLTDAATGMASGDYNQTVAIKRSDELGLLGRAFTVMASEVRRGRETLESKVDERTRDLNSTLGQLRDAQDTLVRRERLAILGQLSSGVGHELRNPLGVMTNAVYYLKMVLAESPPNVHEYLDILQQQITLSEKIVGDLLDFARQKPPQRKPTRLEDVTAAQIARLGSINGVEIDAQLASKQLPVVLVDDVQIGQVVLNLLTNALQAMNNRGRVTIRAFSDGDRVHYEVSDTGPGVAKENMEKVFEPLFTTKARGIGLGLAVSRTLARANEGDLTVYSTPGEGATFRLTVPVAPEGKG